MSCLHTISRSPKFQLLETCLSVIGKGDALLFIEDGIYHCTSQGLLETIDASTPVFALSDDMKARAVLVKIDDSVEAIDYHRFVELSCDYDKVVSWF